MSHLLKPLQPIRTLLLSALLLTGISAVAAETPAATVDAPATVDALATITAAAKSITTVQGEATQRTSDRGQKGEPPALSTLRFAMQTPNRYDVVVVKPRDPDFRQRFCSDGTTHWEVVQLAPDQPVDVITSTDGERTARFRRIMACVRGDLTALQREFTLTAQAVPAADAKAAAGYRLDLVPATPAVAQQVERFQIDVDAELHARVITIEDASVSLVISIDRAVYNQPIDAARFSYVATGAVPAVAPKPTSTVP